ncbi:MAG: heavy metal translocating P-type ATPase metal-binding domain-containing protein, partial [Gammaproteobacteria bacterium]|nr:heavy metal translocating P-type ATPase metal-binding domain-containing protein [Gammaproteobacteria bacterium]
MLHTTADHSCSVTQERLTCFHCGLPVPPGVALSVAMQETPRPMCCPGCQSIAQTIVDSGLDAYYQHRTAMPESGATIIPDALRQHQVYDHPDVQQSFVRHESENICEASLILEGVTCGACVWLIEHQVTKLLGVQRIEINYSTRRARVYWDRSRIKLSEVLQEINRIGYVAHPYDSSTRQDVLEAERKKLLQRLGVAGVLGMQVMVLAVALYSGEWYGIELEFARFFRRVSLILTIPVLLYSGQPFLLGAWRDISNKRAGMDVPI